MSNPEAILRWYGVLLLATLAFAPWVRLLCVALPDRGAAVTRPLALLGMIFPLWFLAGFGLLPYSSVGIWATLVGVGISGWLVAWRRGEIDRTWIRSLVVCETAAILVFLGYVWLRGFTPEIDNTEKPMDIALLSASAQAEVIPPNDPWFSGESINYYYLGYLVHGSVSRLAGVPTEIGFNLALATTGSMAIVAAGGLGFNAVRGWGGRRIALLAGAGAAFLLVVAGNMYAPRRLVSDASATIDADWWNQEIGIGWRSSRIVCDGVRVLNKCDTPPAGSAVETINEFPAFSLLLGDLHPHVMALPFTVVALTLALNLAFLDQIGTDRRTRWVVLLVSGAATGSLYAMNSWDFPTLLLIVAGGAWFTLRGERPRDQILGIVALAGASVVAWLPFYLEFAAPVGSAASALPALVRDVPLVSTVLGTLAAVRGERTSASEFLTMFGLPYAVALVLIGTGLVRRPTPSTVDAPEDVPATSFETLKPWWPLLAIVVIAGLLLPAQVVILCGVPLVLALAQLGRSFDATPRTIATALYALGFALLIGTEFFYIQDLFADRMNTIFKVYFQVWTLFAVASAVGFVAVLQEGRASMWVRPVTGAVGALALVLGLAYPSVAYYQWTGGFSDWRGLDGLAYVEQQNPDEYAAIQWLDDRATSSDVVLEAAGCSYGNSYRTDVRHNRVSAFTGVPTVIGWGWHEQQWRNGQPEADRIGERQAEVREMFADPRSPLFAAYGVTFIYVGSLERDGSEGCRTLEEPYQGVSTASYPGAGWTQVFIQGDVAIYQKDNESTAIVP